MSDQPGRKMEEIIERLRSAHYNDAAEALSQALRELGEARADVERVELELAASMSREIDMRLDRDAALRSTAELTQEMARLETEWQKAIEEDTAANKATYTANAELRGALEAFKDCADTFDESTPDSFPLFSFNEDNEMEELEIELGDLRKARTALASSPPAGTDKDGLRKALGDTVIIDPGIRDGRPVLPGTGFMIADLLAEISDSAGVAEVADGFDLDAKRISNFLDALSGAINDALASSSTKE